MGVGRIVQDRSRGIGNTGDQLGNRCKLNKLGKSKEIKKIVYKGIMFDVANDRPYLNTNRELIS